MKIKTAMFPFFISTLVIGLLLLAWFSSINPIGVLIVLAMAVVNGLVGWIFIWGVKS